MDSIWSGLNVYCPGCKKTQPVPAAASGEQWRNVLNFEGRYSVSNLGRIRSIRFLKRGMAVKLIAAGPGSVDRESGYRKGALRVSRNTSLPFNAHELIWEAFNGKVPSGRLIGHRIAIRDSVGALDNQLANLYLTDKRGNGRDAADQELLPRGVRHHKCKLTVAMVLQIRSLAMAGFGPAHIRREIWWQCRIRITEAHIRNIILRKSWRHC